ncbi:MAG: hypothetical protein J6R60_03780 [Clostridia bacterium]|jgi:hypothetical protein|nr:hypothetical protein [Clostridia bacterium]
MSKVVKSTVEGSYLMFKGKPLVRQSQMINYGSMNDEYILQMMILKNKEVEIGGVKNEIPSRVIVQIMQKDAAAPGTRKLVKQFDKSSLHDAFTIGYNYMQTLQKKA